MPTTTFLNLKYDIWRAFAHQDEALEGFALPLVTSGTAADKTTVTDTSLTRGTSGGVNMYDYRQVEIVEAETGGPAVGETSWVTNGGFASNALTVSPAFSDEVQTDTNYILWPRGLTRQMVEDEINNVLIHTYGPGLWVPSMVPDSDFTLSTTLADYWADTGSITTTDFDASVLSGTTAPVTLLGEKAIKVVSAAANGGVVSDAFYATEREQLLVSVVTSCTTDLCYVGLYNVTSSASVKSVTVDEPAFTEVRFDCTAPDNMESGQMRFLGTANGSTFYISPPVVVQSYAGHQYPAPSWLVDRSQVSHAVYLREGYQSEDANSYIALSGGVRPAPMPQFLRGARDLNPLHVQFRASGRGPLALVCTRPFASMSADTDTTLCDREYIVNKVIANIRKNRGEPRYRQYKDDGQGWGQYARMASNAARASGYGGRELHITGSRTLVG